jgi:hypothetical protein
MRKVVLMSLFAIFGLMVVQSCEKGGKNERKVSSHGGDDSHNMGLNCMSCHVKKGQGEGWFVVAGTVYKPNLTQTLPNSTVRLYTGPNGTGTVARTIEVDANGNFYTTEDLDFGNGLYPSVQGPTSTKYMSTPITVGTCNNCHGQSTDRIWGE